MFKIKMFTISQNVSLEDLKRVTNLNETFCYSLIDNGCFIYQEGKDWYIVGNNDFDGWKTMIPKGFLGGDLY